MLGDADPGRYGQALEVLAHDPNTDGLLVILTPQAMTDPTGTADMVKAHGKIAGKPLLASWMGGNDVALGESLLLRAAIPVFPYPDTAARTFNTMWRYSHNLRSLYETPALAGAEDGDGRAEALIASVLASGRTLLTEAESRRLSRLYGTNEAEFALLVRDAFQRRGLGAEILRRLVAIGRDERMQRIRAVILPQNRGMLRICDKLGFHTSLAETDRLVYAELALSDPGK